MEGPPYQENKVLLANSNTHNLIQHEAHYSMKRMTEESMRKKICRRRQWIKNSKLGFDAGNTQRSLFALKPQITNKYIIHIHWYWHGYCPINCCENGTMNSAAPSTGYIHWMTLKALLYKETIRFWRRIPKSNSNQCLSKWSNANELKHGN